VHLSGDRGKRQLDLRNNAGFPRADSPGEGLRREARRGESELKRSGGGGGKGELPVVVGERVNAGGLVFASEFHLSTSERGFLRIDNCTGDGAWKRLSGLLGECQRRECAREDN